MIVEKGFGGGRYLVEVLLGKGGQKSVYRARDTVLDRICALAVVEGDAGSDELDRVRREARALARMGAQPNIVTVYDLGEEEGRPFIVSELVTGGDLATELELRGSLPLARVLEIARDLLRALDAVHRRGIVHRDIKPRNILLAESGAPKLGDFGLAIGGDAPQISQTGVLSFTPTYAAPEQLEGREIDGRTDLYALGCTLYELLVGRPPFSGSTVSVIAQHLHATPTDPRAHVPSLPEAVVRFVLRLVAKSPDDRPASAAAALEELKAIEGSSAVPSAPRPEPARPIPAKPPQPASGDSVEIRGTTLLGRDDERRRIQVAIDRAGAADTNKVMLLRGEPGIGKTRLLEEIARQVELRGGSVLRARAFEAEMIRPYGVWMDALATAELFELEDRTRLFEEVAAALTKTQKAALLILDDIHWIDDASAALLHFVVRATRGSGLLIALGTRRIELEDNEAASKVIAAFARSGWLDVLDLNPLDEATTTRLITTLMPEVDPRSVYEESGGNPLFAIEIARARSAGLDGASETLEGLISDRLHRLSERSKAVLPWAAALGRSFELSTLVTVSEISETEIVDATEELVRRGVLVPGRATASIAFDFAHDMLRRAAYRTLSEPRRQLVHRRIARGLAAASGAQDDILGDIAHHAELGGEKVLAAVYCVKAGERCLRLHAYAEARSLADRGRRFLASVPEEMRLNLHIRLVGLYFNPRVEPQVVRMLDEEVAPLLHEAIQKNRSDDVARAYGLRSWFAWATGNLDYAQEASFQRASVSKSLGDAEHVRALGEAVHCMAVVERDIPVAKLLFGEAQALASRLGRQFWELNWAGATLAYFEADFDVARNLFEESLRRASDAENPWHLWLCHVLLAKIDLEVKHFEEAGERSVGLLKLAEKLGEGSGRAFAVAVAAIARLARGDADADTTLDGALAELLALDATNDLSYMLHRAADLDLALGRTESAQRRAARSLALSEAGGWKSEAASAREVLVRVALATGDRAEASKQLEAARPILSDPLAVRRIVRQRVEALEALIAPDSTS